MPNDDAARNAFRSPIAVGAIAAAMILTGSVQPSHAATDVFAAFKNSGSIASGKPIVTLRVPGGLYAIFGKINIDQDDTAKWVTVVCTLQAGTDLDQDVSRLQPSGGASLAVDNAAVRLQLVHVLPSDERTNIELSCKFNASESSLVSFRFAKITAIRLDGEGCEEPSAAKGVHESGRGCYGIVARNLDGGVRGLRHSAERHSV